MVRLRNLFSRLVVLHILVVLLCKSGILVWGLNYTKYRQVGDLRLARIQKHLDTLNKPPVFSIESPDGDIIDCVHKRKQPALDHPLLKNHKIQRVPPAMPKMKSMGEKEEESISEKSANISKTGRYIGKGAWQMWHKNGERCPKGTVPVRRSTVHDVLRADSLYDFGKKRHRNVPLARRADAPDVVSGNGHEHAIAYTGSSSEIYGAKATINVWDPKIEVINEFSLSQIWVLSGSFDGSDLNSIEAGWQVSPELYGDSRPRLFTYWTSDAYQATGCYNLLCSGFVQTNSRIAIGAAISPLSEFQGSQFDVTIVIWKDPKLGNWWMGFGENTLVGYWPAELFTHLADRATMVEWGGEIVNSRANGEHTSTAMGSGHFAEDGFGKASYFRNLEIVDSDNSLVSAHDISTLAENTNCYNIKSSSNNQWGTYFYYGGPGFGALLLRKMAKQKDKEIRENWPDSWVLSLCGFLNDYITKHGRSSTFKWTELQPEFEKIIDHTFISRGALKNKYDNMKKDYIIWKSLKNGETGLGWDESTKTLICLADWWKEKIKENSKYRKLKKKQPSMELQEAWDQLFGDAVASGVNCVASSMEPSHVNEVSSENLEDDDVMSGDGVHVFQANNEYSSRLENLERQEEGFFEGFLDGVN